jgi:hypothetical protein
MDKKRDKVPHRRDEVPEWIASNNKQPSAEAANIMAKLVATPHKPHTAKTADGKKRVLSHTNQRSPSYHPFLAKRRMRALFRPQVPMP